MNNSSDIVSPNVRGAVLALASRLGTADVFTAFERAGLPRPETLSDYNYSNPGLFSAEQVFRSFSASVNWKEEQATRSGLIAYSIIVRRFGAFGSPYFNDDEISLLEEVDYVCSLEGLVFSRKGIALPHNVIDEDDFELGDLVTFEGVQKQIDAINRAYEVRFDNSEIVSRSKNLVESVAKSILVTLGASADELKNVQTLAGLTKKVHEAVGVDKLEGGDKKMAQSMGQLITGLNGLVDGLAQQRNRGNTSHGDVIVIETTDASAQLSFSVAKAWCAFVLGLFHEMNKAPF